MQVPTSKIKPNPKNPRLIKDGRFDRLKKSLQDFPQMLEKRPLVCFTDTDGKYVVLGGNMRLRAAKELGMKELPVLLADDWTEEQKAQFLIKDNVGYGEWDHDQLANEWDTDKLIEWGMELPSFDPVVEYDEEADLAAIDETTPTDIAIGDLFEIGEHRLLCGDSTDSDAVAKLMDGEKADLLITDLPYGVSYSDKNKFLNEFYKGNRNQKNIENDHVTPKELYNLAKAIYTNLLPFISNKNSYYAFMPQGGEQMMMMMMALNDSGYKVKHELIWLKNNHVLGRSDYNYKHEPICYGWTENGTHEFFGGFKTSVLEFNRPNSSKEHPTMKPIELISELIKNSSKETQLILDPTLGSGSTMAASHQIKRKCYGMELDTKYCQVIVDRMHRLFPDLIIKRNGQPYNKPLQ